MGFFHDDTVTVGNIARNADLLTPHRNAAQIRDELRRFHGWEDASTDGVHAGLAYYWERGEIDVKDDTYADLVTILQCADPLLFAGRMWVCEVTLSWVEGLYSRGLFCEMTWAGTPTGDSYMKWGPMPPARESASAVDNTHTDFAAGTTLASVNTGDIAVIIDIDDPESAVSGIDWHVRVRLSPYWSSTYSPGKVNWDVALIPLG